MSIPRALLPLHYCARCGQPRRSDYRAADGARVCFACAFREVRAREKKAAEAPAR